MHCDYMGSNVIWEKIRRNGTMKKYWSIDEIKLLRTIIADYRKKRSNIEKKILKNRGFRVIHIAEKCILLLFKAKINYNPLEKLLTHLPSMLILLAVASLSSDSQTKMKFFNMVHHYSLFLRNIVQAFDDSGSVRQNWRFVTSQTADAETLRLTPL